HSLVRKLKDLKATVIRDNSALSEEDLSWTEELGEADSQLTLFLERDKDEALQEVLDLLDGILSTQPARVNDRMVQTAQELKLGSLIEAMKSIGGALHARPQDRGAVECVRRGVTGLCRLNERLLGLVERHNNWQDLHQLLKQMEVALSDQQKARVC